MKYLRQFDIIYIMLRYIEPCPSLGQHKNREGKRPIVLATADLPYNHARPEPRSRCKSARLTTGWEMGECIYPTPPPRVECNTRSFLNGVLLVWIQRFPFLRLFASPKLKNPVYLFTHSLVENGWVIAFPKGIRVKWNARILVQDLNPFSSTITVMLTHLPVLHPGLRIGWMHPLQRL